MSNPANIRDDCPRCGATADHQPEHSFVCPKCGLFFACTCDDSFLPDWYSPPGDTIARILEEHSLRIEELASSLGWDYSKTCRLIAGDEDIGPDVANTLSKFLGSTQQFWLNRERRYRNERLRLTGSSHAITKSSE